MSSVQKSRTPGRPTALAYDEEAQLANYITTMCTPGFSATSAQILNLVKEYVEIHNIKSSFKNNRPGKDWLKGFMTRHKLKKANINHKKQPSVPITTEESTPQQTIQQSLTPATFLELQQPLSNYINYW